MFSGGIFSVSGNIPSDDWSAISKIADRIFQTIRKLANDGTFDRHLVRLLRPVNTAALLTDTDVHIVCTNKGVGGASRVVHTDLRGRGSPDIATAIAIVERDLVFEDPFGLSFPASWVGREPTDEEILGVAESYYRNEVAYHDHLACVVRINPIFNARDLLRDDNLCFVLMPLSEANHVQEIYRDQVLPTVEAAGFRCVRADDIYDTQPIVESIWENVMSARFLIADLTGRNPNVFYELGIAHTVGKEVILLSQDIDDVPFDLRHLRVILYETTSRGAETLTKRLRAMVSNVARRR